MRTTFALPLSMAAWGPPPGGAPPQGGWGPPQGAPPAGPAPGWNPQGPAPGYGAQAPYPPNPYGGAPGYGAQDPFQPNPYGGAPGGAPNPYAMAVPGSEIRLHYAGTGGELFGQLFVGYLLTVVTLGVYLPWFMVKMLAYVASRTTMSTPRGPVAFCYAGTGGAMFGQLFVGYLLTVVTLGIYAPWFACKLARHLCENSWAQTQDGARYNLQFSGQGGSLFGTFIVGAILTGITFGIYLPWFICKLRKFFMSNTQILGNGQPVGSLDFIGEGGTLFGTFIVGMILTMITLQIYRPWFDCSLARFWLRNDRAHVMGASYCGEFDGGGAELFGIYIVGLLLTIITLGIYAFWFMTNVIRFYADHSIIRAGNPPPQGP